MALLGYLYLPSDYRPVRPDKHFLWYQLSSLSPELLNLSQRGPTHLKITNSTQQGMHAFLCIAFNKSTRLVSIMFRGVYPIYWRRVCAFTNFGVFTVFLTYLDVIPQSDRLSSCSYVTLLVNFVKKCNGCWSLGNLWHQPRVSTIEDVVRKSILLYSKLMSCGECSAKAVCSYAHTGQEWAKGYRPSWCSSSVIVISNEELKFQVSWLWTYACRINIFFFRLQLAQPCTALELFLCGLTLVDVCILSTDLELFILLALLGCVSVNSLCLWTEMCMSSFNVLAPLT